MEGQSDYNKSLLELMESSFVGVYEDTPNQQFINQPDDALDFPQGFNCPRMPQNYFRFLTENSSKVSTADDVSGRVSHSDNGTCFGEGFSDIQRQLLYSNPEMTCGGGSKPAYFSNDWDLKPHSYMLNGDIHESSPNVIRPLVSHNSVVKQLDCSQPQSSWTQNTSEDFGHDLHMDPRIPVPASVIQSNSRKSAPNRRATRNDRLRRVRISERIRALQELLPHSAQGSQAAVMDDIMAYIKHLQLQMQELSWSRLGDESTSGRLLFVEGYGHYILPEQIMNEPLEEMMGKLMQENPSAATKLMKTRGLYCDSHGLANSLS